MAALAYLDMCVLSDRTSNSGEVGPKSDFLKYHVRSSSSRRDVVRRRTDST